MSVTNHRTGRDITTKYATTAFGPDRETVDEAFPGDVVGLVNASGVQLGDTLYDAGYAGLAVEFPPIPRFSPEVFAKARPLDNGRFKQFRKGLAQLDEEGVVQVLRDPDFGETETILAAVGELQFEVFAYRLGSEFGAPTEILSAPVPGDPADRQGIERAATRHRRDPHPHPRRRRTRRAVRESLPVAAPRKRRARADAAADHRRLTASAARHGEVHPDVAADHESQALVQPHRATLLFDMQTDGPAEAICLGEHAADHAGAEAVIAVFGKQSDIDDLDVVPGAIE